MDIGLFFPLDATGTATPQSDPNKCIYFPQGTPSPVARHSAPVFFSDAMQGFIEVKGTKHTGEKDKIHAQILAHAAYYLGMQPIHYTFPAGRKEGGGGGCWEGDSCESHPSCLVNGRRAPGADWEDSLRMWMLIAQEAMEAGLADIAPIDRHHPDRHPAVPVDASAIPCIPCRESSGNGTR